MLYLSLILNILVLIPICYLMLTNNFRMVKTLGEFNPARGILLAMYTTILIGSIYLLIFPDNKFVIALLLMQIVYKLLTPFTVKTVKHPFVISNILIAVVHLVTVYSLW
ncbi:MAG: hypothetical protein RLZZ357_841 [Bacteroidota bacterium]|jgi:hypothetical protein|nr:hypothetical protein [Bacteroidota bacterium]NBX64566.1 hypothetical protein [Bacteroidota bacterium]